jgi:hypothetical protein
MRKTARLFVLFLALGFMFVIVGCTDPIVDDTPYNALGEWEDGGDGVYDILTNTEDELGFAYNKGAFPDAYMTSPEFTKNLTNFKKLVITVEGTGTMLVRLETEDETPAREVRLNVTGLKGTYEWNLNDHKDFLAVVNRIVVIGAPGKEESIGSISVTEMSFYKSVADGFIINDGFDNIPSNVNEYNGTDETFDFNQKWQNFSEGIYDITEEEDHVTATFDKPAGEEWAAMQSFVQGDFTEFNYLVAKVTGTDGQPFILKAADGVETKEFLSDEVTEVVVDLTGMSTEDKNAITFILAFGNAGRTGTGEFTVHEAFFAKDYDYEAPEYDVNVYDGGESEFALVHWYDGGDLVYTITEGMDGFDVVYDKPEASMHWSNMLAYLDGDFSDFTEIEFVLTGTTDKSVLLKIEGPLGNVEETVVFDGTEQTVTVDLSSLTTEQMAALNKVLVFAAPGGTGTGAFTIHSVTFKADAYSFLDGWYENDEGTYDFTMTDDALLVDYTKIAGQEWAFMRIDFDPEDVQGLNTLTMTFVGTEGMELLVKPNDSGSLESWVDFTEKDTVTITATAESFENVLIFADPNMVSTGSFEITKATLTYVRPAALDPEIAYDFTHGWVDNDGDIYTFNDVEGTNVVTFDKEAGQEWSFMKYDFDQDLANHNTISLTIQGDEGLELLLKPNDNWEYERVVTLSAEPQTFVFEMDETPMNFLMFVSPMQGTLTGTFEILSAQITYVEPPTVIESPWTDNDGDIYTFDYADGKTTVTFDKEAGQEWSFMKNTFAGDLSEFNVITVHVTGDEGLELLFKPNDMGIYEQLIELTGDPQEIVFEMTDVPEMMLLFTSPMQGRLTGSFEIEMHLSYVEPAPIDMDVDIDFTLGPWIDNDGGIYTFTEVEGAMNVSFNKEAGQEWAFMKYEFEENLLNHNTITLVIYGDEGLELLIKPNDNWEYERVVTLTVEPQTFVFEGIENPMNVLIFVSPMQGNLTGEFVIDSAIVSHEAGDLDLEANWIDNDGDIYTFDDVEGETIVTFDKEAGQEWAFMKTEFDLDLSIYNTLIMHVTGEAGLQILVKPNDYWAYEQTVTFTGEEQTIVFTLDDELENILIFADPFQGGLTGTFTIHGLVVSYVEPEPEPSDPDFTTGWTNQDQDVYTILEVEGTTEISFNKEAGQEWSFIRYDFAGNFETYNTFTLTVNGDAGLEILLKANNNNAYEQWVTLTGEDQDITLQIDETPVSLFIFFDPIAGTLEGNMDILHAELTYNE